MAFKWIWHELKGYRLRMAFGLTIVLVCTVLAMVNPYLSGMIVDQVILGQKYHLLMNFLAIIFGTALLRETLRYAFQMVFESVSQNVLFQVKVQMYTKFQTLDFGFFDKTRTGDIMNKLSSDTDIIRHFVAWVIYNVFENLMTFLFAIVCLLVINWQLTLILLPMVLLSGYLNFKLSREVKPTFFAIREQLSQLNSVVQENISGHRVVKAFAKEDYEIEKFTRENQSYRQKNIVSAKVWGKYLPLLEAMAGALGVVIILAGGIMVIRGGLTMGELVAFNSFSWALNNPMRMSGWLINDIQRFATSGEKILELLKTESTIANPERPLNKERFEGRIEFKNVSVSVMAGKTC